MRSLKLQAFAKANLSLNITGRDGGMHTLDSVMVTLDAFDTVTVTERGDKAINVSFVGADVDPVNNTAYKAAAAVMDAIGCNGFDISVVKGIPVGAGLGGSSADGAAVLRALDIFYRLPARGVSMRALALSVGSDVPFMLTGGAARVTGKGDGLFFFDNKLALFAVGLMAAPVSTAEAYKKFDELYAGSYLPTDNDKLVDLLLDGKPEALDMFSNALTLPAAALSPDTESNAATLFELGARAVLTGSGGMTLGWFTNIDALAVCAQKLRGKPFKVFTTAETGILHEWLSKA